LEAARAHRRIEAQGSMEAWAHRAALRARQAVVVSAHFTRSLLVDRVAVWRKFDYGPSLESCSRASKFPPLAKVWRFAQELKWGRPNPRWTCQFPRFHSTSTEFGASRLPRTVVGAF